MSLLKLGTIEFIEILFGIFNALIRTLGLKINDFCLK